MKDSRLIQLIEKFNTKELRELEQFIQCDFFHTNKRQKPKVIQLFQELISPNYRILRPSKEILTKKLLKRKGANKNEINRYISWAIDLVQKYLVYKYQIKDTNRFDSNLLNALLNKKLLEPFDLLKSKMQRNLAKTIQKGKNYYYYNYEIADASLMFNDIRGKVLAYQNVDLENATYSVDLFFLINQLNYACQTININHIIKSPQCEFLLLEIIIDKLPQTHYFQIPLIQMLWTAYKMLSTDKNTYYLSLKSLLFKNYLIVLEYYQINLFTYLENYSIQKINKGNRSYLSEYWEIRVFRAQTKLDLATYKNMITTGVMLDLKQKRTDFINVFQFIEEYTHKLQPKYQKEAKTYAYTYIAFYQNNFKIVPQKLTISEAPLTLYKFQDIYYKIDARRLVVMAYFCLEEDDNFDKMCSNLSVFLSERKEIIPELELEKNRQFLLIIKKIFWLPINKTERKRKLEELKKEIEEVSQISDRTWLLKQIEAKLN